MDVRLEHRLLVFLGALPERVAAERETCVVDEDVQSPECVDGGVDEAPAALRVAHVELVCRDLVGDLVDTARAACDRRFFVGEAPRDGRADAG